MSAKKPVASKPAASKPDYVIADIGLALAYVAYAFVFNLIYDRAFPIESAESVSNPSSGENV